MPHGIDSRPIHTEARASADDFLESAATIHEDAPVYFLHIPKTGGTALVNILESFYAPTEIFPYRLGWSEFVRKKPAADTELPQQYALYQGNFTCNLRKVVRRRLRYLTVLRNPIERALSYYAAVMSDEDHFLHRRARQLKNFESYLHDPETRPTIANFQLRMIAFDVDPLEAAVTGSGDNLALERALETKPFDLSEQQLLERAKTRLRSFCMVGISERYDDSISLMCELFEWPVPDLSVVRERKPSDSHQEHIDPVLLKQLQQANQADLALYAYAGSLFEEALRNTKLTRPSFGAFVSYASNQEDVILHRVFSNVNRGCYIDVGAQDPVGDSVTKAFYDRGWRGINIEPVERYYRRLQQERPDEINIQALAGASAAVVNFYEVENTGLSTVSRTSAESYAAQGFTVRPQSVAVKTLTEICDSCAVNDLHFLKIDAEGSEADVLRGLDLQKIRPWVIVIEATIPNSPEPNFDHWEALIQNYRYECVYKDGLNRFYLAAERAALRAHFQDPPNVFDRFVRSSELSLREKARGTAVRYRIVLRELERLHRSAGVEAKAFEVERKQAIEQIKALTNSLTIAEAYAKTLERERERVLNEVAKQIAELTASVTATEAYAKSLERERERVLDETVKQIAELTVSLTATEAYAKSLERDRERVHDEVVKQIEALAASKTSADAHVEALLTQLERARDAASAHTLEQQQLMSLLEKTEAKLDSYRKHWIFRVLGHPR